MDILIRPLQSGDREPLASILLATGVFRPEELDIAMEVVDEGLAKGPGGHYAFAVAEVKGTGNEAESSVAGYASWGPTPCTQGTFDLYWIATDPARHGCGVGRRLMEEAEADMKGRRGRLCVVETSSLPAYDPTRRFYLRLGYTEEAIIKDFYTPGDHKVIYTKVL